MQSHALRRVTWSTATSRTTTAGASNWPESEADDASTEGWIGRRSMPRTTTPPPWARPRAIGTSQTGRPAATRLRKARGGSIDVRYGAGPRQRLDVFECGMPPAPTLVYIHGGYWQMNDKEPYAFLGEGVSPPGSTWPCGIHAGAGGAARRDRRGGSRGRRVGDRPREGVRRRSGSRVRDGALGGRHLTAMAMDDGRVAGGIAISGIYDLEPYV